jgi:hypothetical protein
MIFLRDLNKEKKEIKVQMQWIDQIEMFHQILELFYKKPNSKN